MPTKPVTIIPLCLSVSFLLVNCVCVCVWLATATCHYHLPRSLSRSVVLPFLAFGGRVCGSPLPRVTLSASVLFLSRVCLSQGRTGTPLPCTIASSRRSPCACFNFISGTLWQLGVLHSINLARGFLLEEPCCRCYFYSRNFAATAAAAASVFNHW
eukprot:COSAG06_NODE_23299_length_696_cov_1.738693_1_plen_155_part_10